jgi:hypothetical protein
VTGDPQPTPKVTPYLLRRAADLCSRRLAQEYGGEFGSEDPVNRGRVRDTFLDAARTAHALGGALADAPWRVPPGLDAEEVAVVEQAVHWYCHLFGDRAVALADHDLDRPSEVDGIDVRLGGWVDLTVVGEDGTKELRQLDFWGGRVPGNPLDQWNVRLAMLRLAEWIGDAPCTVSWSDLLHGVRRERVVDPNLVLPQIREELDEMLAVVAARVASPQPEPGLDCASCRFLKGCTEFPKAITVRTRRNDVRPGVLSMNPSAVEAWHRCPRLWRSKHLFAVPESDSGAPGVHGQLVHDLLRQLHRDGPCDVPARIDDLVTGHGASDRVHAELMDHARRCPKGAQGFGHEITRARLYARYPNFLASARIDAAWIHNGLLDVRDYKTGSAWHSRVADDPRARVQAWVMAPIAEARGLQLRIRYEHLAAEIDDDPDDWAPDADDLMAVQDELVALVTAIREETEWRGVNDVDTCRTCEYRSICPDSAVPGEPAWPRVEVDHDLDAGMEMG